MGVQLTPAAMPASSAVELAHREHWGRVLASTLRFSRDLDIAEESTADAFELALRTWAATGVPRSVEAWLITAARRRAIDRIRRESRLRLALSRLDARRLPQTDDIADRHRSEDTDPAAGTETDDELRLAILCAHPALSEQSQVMLMLRLACGASTEAIAAAFLSKPAATAARLTRAKKAIAETARELSWPDDRDVEARMAAVRSATYLTYTLGHTAGDGHELGNAELVGHARHLATTLARQHPAPENAGLLALILLTEARAAGRVVDGAQVLLEDVDRGRWNAAQTAAGLSFLDRAMRVEEPGPYALQAAIAAEHATAASFADNNWSRVVDLYARLLTLDPNPTFAVGRAVAISHAVSAAAGLADLDDLAGLASLTGYPYLHAARAACLARLGRDREARAAYGRATSCARNDAERAFFAARS